MQEDTKNLLNPLFNRDNIGDGPIMNAKIDKEQNSDIDCKVRNFIKLTKDWIKRPFKLDPIPQMVFFHAQAHLAKGLVDKVIVPMLTDQSLVRPEMMHQLDSLVGYY